MLFDESDHFRRFGSSSDAKKLKRPSPTRWCRAAGDFLDATVRFLQQGPRALIPHPRPSRRAGLRPLPRRVPRDAQLWCHDLAGCLHGNVLRQNAIFYQAHDSVLRLLIKLLRQVRRFSHLLKRNKTWDTSAAVPTNREQAVPRIRNRGTNYPRSAQSSWRVKCLLLASRLASFAKFGWS